MLSLGGWCCAQCEAAVGPCQGASADGGLCSVWSSSVLTHCLFHCSCFDLHFISVEHPIALLLECAGVELQVCSFQALQPEHKKQRQRRKCLETPAHCCHAGRQLRLFPWLFVLPASPGQPEAAAWPWLYLATSRVGFLTSPGAFCGICGSSHGRCTWASLCCGFPFVV